MTLKPTMTSETMPSVNQYKVKASPSELTPKQQMQLGKHKVTNILALMIIFVYLATVFLQAWKGKSDVVQELRVLVFIIVGYYFGRGIENGN
jgi:hypothetical protein